MFSDSCRMFSELFPLSLPAESPPKDIVAYFAFSLSFFCFPNSHKILPHRQFHSICLFNKSHKDVPMLVPKRNNNFSGLEQAILPERHWPFIKKPLYSVLSFFFVVLRRVNIKNAPNPLPTIKAVGV